MMLKKILPGILAVTVLNVYAAEIPQSASLKYSGSYGVPASMQFKRNGNQYTIVADIKVPLYKIRFESGGTIHGNELRPSYYRDVRNGKLYASAQFSGSNVSYGKSGETKTEAISGRVMDLFTLSWQLAFNDGKLPANLRITNGKRLYRVGAISKNSDTQMKINGSNIVVNRFTVKRGDDSVQYGFAPTLQNMPAIIDYNDGGKNYRLNLKSLTVNGVAVKP